jgi:uncharacterized protein
VSTAEIIELTADRVKSLLSGEGSGHDWWHIERVWRMAKRIGLAEDADLPIVELAALLHDIADWKAYGGDATVGPTTAKTWLDSLGVDSALTQHVVKSSPTFPSRELA